MIKNFNNFLFLYNLEMLLKKQIVNYNCKNKKNKTNFEYLIHENLQVISEYLEIEDILKLSLSNKNVLNYIKNNL